MLRKLEQISVRIRPALAGVAVAAFALAAPDPVLAMTMPDDLAQAVEAYDRATIANDTETLAELIADDYVLVNSNSTVQNKQEYLADFLLPGFRIEPYMMREPIQKAWGDAAVTGGLLPLSWEQDGAEHARLLRIVHVWSKQDDRWRITHTQLTQVPE